MSFQKIKASSYCVGGRHRSATTNIYGFITSIRFRVLFVYCYFCNTIKCMTAKKNTTAGEGLGDFLKSLGMKV